MAAMAALLKASSSSSYCRNQSTNRRFIITPPLAPTRISFPINRKITHFPKITTATTKCSNSNSSKGSTIRGEEEDTKSNSNSSKGSTIRGEEEDTKSSSSSSRGSTFREEDPVPFPFERVKEAMVKKILKVVKGLEKPALTAILVWVLLTNNPTISYSSSSRTAFFWGVWFVYDVCKAIATTRRIGDNGSIRFSLGNVLGSTVLLFSGSMSLLMAVLVVVLMAAFIGIVLFLCGLMAVILLLTGVFIGMVFGFGKVTWYSSETEHGSVNTTSDEHEKKKKKKSTKVQV